MRIGIDATCCWNRRGFGRFTRELLQALVDAYPDHDYALLVDRNVEPGEIPEGTRALNVRPQRTVTASAVSDGRRSTFDMLRFTRAVKRLAPDVLFYPAVYSFFPVPRGTRSVVCFHDTIAEDFPELVFDRRSSRWAWNAKVRLALWQCTRVMTISEASRQSIRRRFNVRDERIDLVTEGPSPGFRVLSDRPALDERLSAFGVASTRPYLLFVGGISPHKNLTTLLDAMPLVLEQHDVELVLVGDPGADGFLASSNELRRKIEHDPLLSKNCSFTGYVSDADLVDLYNGAHALVFPSLSEGFGLPAVEAMACGLPVLASDRTSLPEIVGDAGLLFDPLDPRMIADTVLRVLNEPALHARLSANALGRARHFSWRRAAEMAMSSLEKAAR